MDFFSQLIDLFSASSDEPRRLRMSLVIYKTTSQTDFKYLHLFGYSEYDNITSLKEFLNNVSYDNFNSPPDAMNVTTTISKISTDFGDHGNAQKVCIFVMKSLHVNRLLTTDLKFWNESFSLFLVIVGHSNYDSSDPTNYVVVNKYSSLQFMHEIPLTLCGTCYPGWFLFEERHRESLLWISSCYNLVISEQRIAWSDSLKRCQGQHSSLASIESAEELEFLEPILSNITWLLWEENTAEIFPNEFLVHIGLIRDQHSLSKRFQWINKSPLSVTHWTNDVTPNGGYVQSCGAWFISTGGYGGGWDDFGCGYRNARFYLCETNVVSLNLEYDSNLTTKSIDTKIVQYGLQNGELVSCADADAFLSTSGVIGRKNHKDCVLFSQQESVSLRDVLHVIAVFNCQDKDNTVVAYSFVCDHVIHCPNGRDEEVCRYRMCRDGAEFTCSSKQCVPVAARCDLYEDCYDGSDEQGCSDCKYNQCQDGTCLPTHWWYDDETDCIWGQFAEGYTWDIDSPRENRTGKCAFLCNRTQCVTKQMLNDGVIDCLGPEGPLDETLGALETSTCQEIFEPSTSNSWSPRCVYYRDRYQAPLGCRNMMHLQGCHDFVCPRGYLKCPRSYCIPMHQAHDGTRDCPRGEDELDQFFPTCKGGNFVCMYSRVCLHLDLVCDNFPHCPKGDDELNCKITCKAGFLCVGGAVTVYSYDRNTPLLSLDFIDPRIRYLNLSGVILTDIFPVAFLELSMDNLNVLILIECKIKDLGNYSFADFSSGMYRGRSILGLSSVHMLDLSHNNIHHINEYSVLKTMHNLRDLNLSHNQKLTQINPMSFLLLGLPNPLQFIDLSNTQISTTANLFNPLASLIYLNLSNTPLAILNPETFRTESHVKLKTLDLRNVDIVYLQPDTFQGVSISSGMYTDTYILCCPQVRGSGIHSDVCHAPTDPLSSCSDLMGEEFKRALLWLAGLLAVFGNLIVIVYRIRWTRPLLMKAYGMFVVHLAVSDVIMGIYLLIIASADVYYRNVYVWYERQWRKHTVCQIAGFASMLSSEVSTSFVFFITVDRFLALKYPFSNVRLSRKMTIMICSLIWLLGCAIALVPLLPKFRYWAIYSSNGMCLGLPLTSRRLPGWQFSSAIFIGFNFVMFLLIAIGQIYIYRIMAAANKVQRDLCGVANIRQQQDFAVARQLFLVAMSNFACWFPIAIMGFVSLSGYEIGLSAFAWSTVLIMPINAALNPLLYTVPAAMKKIAGFRKEEGKKRPSPNHVICSKCQHSFTVNTAEDKM